MNNYVIASMIHNVAMEAADFAKLAQIKGDKEEHLRQLQLAFTLDKSAALRLQSEPDDNEWKFLFLSSAGWLAYQLELYDEAIHLVELGLQGTSDGVALHNLQELKIALKEKVKETYNIRKTETPSKHLLYGLLASADVEQEELKVKASGETDYQIIKASKELIQTVARYLIGDFVEIDTQQNEEGVMVLKAIRQAA